MPLASIPTGRAPPSDIFIVIEIPQGSAVKYEVDSKTGAIFVDRFLFTTNVYPSAYGFIPGTAPADRDPLDALVLTPTPVLPGVAIRARPIGVLHMEDEEGRDEKIICVPHETVHPGYSGVDSVADLPPIARSAIEHFFAHYKDLEPGKWTKVHGWGTKEEAEQIILHGIETAR